MTVIEIRYYHVKPSGLRPGDVLRRGSYGQYLLAAGMSATDDPIQEYLREQIRQASYPKKPSRLYSSFVFETLADAQFFRDNLRIGSSIYEVTFRSQPVAVHRVCYTAWNPDFPNHMLQAHEFWGAPQLYGSNTELFAEEDLVVLQQV